MATKLNIGEIYQKKSEIIENYGPWTAHNMQLTGGIFTMQRGIVGDEIKLRRIMQIIADIADKPLKRLRVLDLACLEGLYSVELARHGAKVVAIEGRQANIEKASFAKEVLSLENLELCQDDVRNLNKEKYGEFDVVLCLGILYHLDAPDIIQFLESIGEVCKKFVIVDTHISGTNKESFLYKGKTYWGEHWFEHNEDSTTEERLEAKWASLDNTRSFRLTRPSLLNGLSIVGFSSVYECYNPPVLHESQDRVVFLAIKGKRANLKAAPELNIMPIENWPEGHSRFTLSSSDMRKKGKRSIRKSIKGLIKKALGS